MTPDAPSAGRRAVLAGLAGAFGGLAGCAGALGVPGRVGEPGRTSGTVSLLAAGSLHNAIENGLRPQVAARLQSEAYGSARLARLVAEGGKDPDIVAVADVSLFDSLLETAWFAEFVTNSVVLAYNPETEGGRWLAASAPNEWYRPLLAGDVDLGRTDPDLDPLGYRTLFTLDLATEYYGTDTDLREAILSDDQRYPETQLISGFETGAIDAAVAYRNMAVERGYAYVELPAEIDLSDPAHAERYATATYELPDGTVVRGAPISYGATVRHASPPALDVFRALVDGQYLDGFGFAVPDDYPRYTGPVPNALSG